MFRVYFDETKVNSKFVRIYNIVIWIIYELKKEYENIYFGLFSKAFVNISRK